MPTEAIPKRLFTRVRIETLQLPTATENRPLYGSSYAAGAAHTGFVTSCWRSRSAGARGHGRARGHRPYPAAIHLCSAHGPPQVRERGSAWPCPAGPGGGGRGREGTCTQREKRKGKYSRSAPPPFPAALPMPPLPARGTGTARYPRPAARDGAMPPPGPAASPPPAGGAPQWPSPIRMRICFLPKRREKSEEMVRPMAAPAALGGGRGALREGGREGARPGRCARTDPSARDGRPAAGAL